MTTTRQQAQTLASHSQAAFLASKDATLWLTRAAGEPTERDLAMALREAETAIREMTLVRDALL